MHNADICTVALLTRLQPEGATVKRLRRLRGDILQADRAEYVKSKRPPCSLNND
jgi:hypothetical protein